jgi:hypothetical protein
VRAAERLLITPITKRAIRREVEVMLYGPIMYRSGEPTITYPRNAAKSMTSTITATRFS